MEIQGFTDRVISLLPEGKYPKHGEIRKFSQKVGISEKLGRSILELKQIPKADTLIKISRAYKKSIDWLLTGEEEIMVDKKQPEKPFSLVADGHEPYSSDTIKEPDKDTLDLLIAAQRVLKSDHSTAPEALKSNIKCFDQAVAESKRLNIFESKLEELLKERNKKSGTDPPLS